MSLFFEKRATYQQLGAPRDPVIAEWFGMTGMSTAGVSVTPDSAMRLTAVYRAVALLATTYASLPLGVFRVEKDGGKVLDVSHPLYDVLCVRPNKWQTSFDWRQMMHAHLLLRGRCYSEIISTGGKAIAELIPLHPDRVRPFKLDDDDIAFEYSPPNGKSRIILRDEMHYVHGLTVGDDGITPLSPIQAAGRDALGLGLAMQQHSSKLFANGTRLGGLLKMVGNMGKDDAKRKRTLDSFNRAFSGSHNAGKTALLEDGLDWTPVTLKSQDAQLLETMQFSIADVSRLFGVPLHLLSELTRSTNNNIEHQGISLVTYTVRPGVVQHEEAMRRDLLFGRDIKRYSVDYNLDGLMRGDSTARASYYSSGTQNGWLTRNEVRVQEGLNPSDDDAMNKFTVQANMTLLDIVKSLMTQQQGANNGNTNQD